VNGFLFTAGAATSAASASAACCFLRSLCRSWWASSGGSGPSPQTTVHTLMPCRFSSIARWTTSTGRLSGLMRRKPSAAHSWEKVARSPRKRLRSTAMQPTTTGMLPGPRPRRSIAAQRSRRVAQATTAMTATRTPGPIRSEPGAARSMPWAARRTTTTVVLGSRTGGTVGASPRSTSAARSTMSPARTQWFTTAARGFRSTGPQRSRLGAVITVAIA